MTRVFVYFNLHKKCWSVKALSGPDKGRVIDHVKAVSLYDAEFRVSEAGRQRVLRDKRKNVHAGVVGYRQEWPWDYIGDGYWRDVKYNPYRSDRFHVSDGTKVRSAKMVNLYEDRTVRAYQPQYAG